MHTEKSLRETVRERLKDSQFVVVSNREPFIHRWRDGEIECIQPASGLTTALDPVLRATSGLWVAHGSGDADRAVVDERNLVAVPPANPRYTLKRVWLGAKDEDLYYNGLANQALWPLCHLVYQRPVFEEAHWEAYRRVNCLFARAVAEEIGDQPAFVFIQDYHFALLSRLIKERCPNAVTAQFWHIPWPNPEIFRICPWKEEILEGLLGNDLLGFHLRFHCLNFLDTVARCLEARVDRERLAVAYRGSWTKVRAFPISVDFDAIQETALSPQVEREMARLRHRYRLGEGLLAVGADRLDYTKGIPERFRAVDRLLLRHPHYRGRFTFLQVGVPSRTGIPQYDQAAREMAEVAERVNHRHQTGNWKPIVFSREHLGPTSLLALYRLAGVCVVSSLDDGMNLVAKEFVSARADEGGVLVLSSFTGAARELEEAVLINPFATDSFAEALRQALEMDPEEARRRMRRLRSAVANQNVYRWAASIVDKLSELAPELPLEEEIADVAPVGALAADSPRA